MLAQEQEEDPEVLEMKHHLRRWQAMSPSIEVLVDACCRPVSSAL